MYKHSQSICLPISYKRTTHVDVQPLLSYFRQGVNVDKKLLETFLLIIGHGDHVVSISCQLQTVHSQT